MFPVSFVHMSADKSYPITRKKNKKTRILYGRPLKSIFEEIFLCSKNVKMLLEHISYIHPFVYKHVLCMLFLVSYLSFEEKSLTASKSMEFPVDTTATVDIKYKG